VLTTKPENREIFRDVEISSKFKDLEQNKNIQNDPIMKNSLKEIIASFKRDGEVERVEKKKTQDQRQMVVRFIRVTCL
jgi:hypothetical protein